MSGERRPGFSGEAGAAPLVAASAVQAAVASGEAGGGFGGPERPAVQIFPPGVRRLRPARGLQESPGIGPVRGAQDDGHPAAGEGLHPERGPAVG